MSNVQAMTREELQAWVALLEQENQKLKANHKSKLKVTDKGGVSLYGMGRWPVTLYKDQWLRLLAQAEDIKAFLQANDSLLTSKED